MKYSHIKITKKNNSLVCVVACIAKAKSSQTASLPNTQKAQQEFLLTFIFILCYDKRSQTRIFRIGIVGTKNKHFRNSISIHLKHKNVPVPITESSNITLALLTYYLLDHFLPCLPHQSQ